MLEVAGLIFREGEVKRPKEGVPSSIDVSLVVDEVSQRTPDSVLLAFSYIVKYNPDLGNIRISGEALCRDSPETITKMLADYKKKKALSPEFGASAINMINANAAMNSIFLIRPFNLIPPFMPPPIAQAPKPESKAEAKPAKKKQA